MSAPISTVAGSLAPGQIEFYDSIQPPLPAGHYSLGVKQDIQNLKDGTQPSYSITQPFQVDGPRFSIDPTAIHMVFPPANQTGLYHDVLPNIVFGVFAMPWLRNIDPKAPPSQTAPPWMGLLTVYAGELPDGATPKMTAPALVTAGQLVSPGSNTILPPVLPDVSPTDPQQVQVIDVQIPYFLGIAPTLAELPMLAHARSVNTDGKVILGLDEDGCFSVVMSNRVVQDGATNRVFLVSLEGHQDHLPGGAAPPAQATAIRLVVLGSWTFTAAASPGSFLELMKELSNPGNGGVDLVMMPESQATSGNALVDGAIKSGFTALANDMRVGETSTSWYRGPFVPAPTTRDFTYGPYHTSDHAMHYDPDCGIFNHAYAAAWQIGRLLALSDAHFAQSLYAWRQQYYTQLGKRVTTSLVEAPVAAAMDSQQTKVGAGLARHLREFFTARVLPSRAQLPQVVPRQRDPRLEQLPGVLNEDDLGRVAAAGEDPVRAVRNAVLGKGAR